MGLISKRSCFYLDPGVDERVCQHLPQDPRRPPKEAEHQVSPYDAGSRLTRDDSFGEAHRRL